MSNFDGWMLLKDPERSNWTISHIELCGIHVQIGSLGSGNIVEGESSSVGYLVYLPITEPRAHAANGTVMDEHSILILEPSSDFCLSVKGPHEWCTIFVPTRILAHGADPLNLSTVDEKTTGQVLRLNPQLVGEVRSFIHDTKSAAFICPKFEITPAGTNAAAEAVRLVSLIIREGQSDGSEQDGRPRFSRQEIIRRCKGLFEERGSKRISVGEMAARAHVSERTLQTAFKEYYGVAPVRYLQLTHLRKINIALRVAQPDATSVAEILSQHGQWQFGRFAERYRRLFGESPSQTLHRH